MKELHGMVTQCENCECVMEYDIHDVIPVVTCPKCGKFVKAKLPTLLGDKALDNLSWDEVRKMPKERIALGATKIITLKNGEIYTLWVVNRTDGLVVGFKDLYGANENGGKALNENGDCAYKDSTLRKWLNNDFYDLLPDDFKAVLATASVQSGGEILEDKVFIPSETEYRGELKFGECEEGAQFELYKDWRNRIAGYPDGDYGRWHWNRTKVSKEFASAGYFCYCCDFGLAYCSCCTDSGGVRPHFLIK